MLKVKLIAGIVCLLLSIPGCSQREERAITFSVGGAPSELVFWEKLIEEFEVKTGTKVNLLRQPTGTDQRRQGLVIALAARKSDPDVFLMDVIWIAQFAASGWLHPLDEKTGADKLDLEVFFGNVLNLADRYEDSLVALPVYVDGGMLYFRKDLLKKWGFAGPPETWSELVRHAGKIQEKMREINPGFHGFVWQGKQYEGLVCNFIEIAASNGGGVFFEDGRIILDTQENLEALKFMHDLIHRYKISPSSTYTEMEEEQARMIFQQGDALFERNWPYAWLLHQGGGSEVRDKTGIAALPHFPSGSSVATLGGWHVGISMFSDRKDLAWELVKYVTSYEVQKRLTLELGWNPARKDLYSDPDVLDAMPHFARLRNIFEHALPRPTVPYYVQLSEVLQRYINAMLAGSMTPEEALALAQRDAQRIVDRYEEK